ncbi:MAG TPA: amidohydrolase family protein [Candidatus Limnocylindria bacterium]|nr:amidohydrolase family protein [Candidatus Limnocylindria bacterium]
MIIDCDTHLMPRDAFNGVGGELETIKPTLKFDDQELFFDVDFPGYPTEMTGTSPLPAPGSGAMFRSLWDPIARMQDYDGRLGIEQHVVLPQFSGWWSYLIEPELACPMARSHNQSLLRLMTEYAGRIFGAALVPLQDVTAAIGEMEWARDHGFCSVVLDKVFPVKAHPYGEPLGSHRELWPFFKRAEELAMPIYLHNVQHGHRMSNLPIFQRDGLYIFAPQEGQMSLVSLITSGLLDEFPQLQFIFTEAGTSFIKPLVQWLDRVLDRPPVDYADQEDPLNTRGALTKVGERLRRARAIAPAQVFLEKNAKPASYYFKNNFYFTIETEEPELPEAIEFLGAERFLFATDYPHDDPGGRMKFEDVRLLREHKKIAEDAKDLIRFKNAQRLFHLGV